MEKEIIQILGLLIFSIIYSVLVITGTWDKWMDKIGF